MKYVLIGLLILLFYRLFRKLIYKRGSFLLAVIGIGITAYLTIHFEEGIMFISNLVARSKVWEVLTDKFGLFQVGNEMTGFDFSGIFRIVKMLLYFFVLLTLFKSFIKEILQVIKRISRLGFKKGLGIGTGLMFPGIIGMKNLLGKLLKNSEDDIPIE